jgi:hypothetical protein
MAAIALVSEELHPDEPRVRIVDGDIEVVEPFRGQCDEHAGIIEPLPQRALVVARE